MLWVALKSALTKLLGRKPVRAPALATHYHITHPYHISHPYHAVSVVPCDGACAMAEELRGRRYLSLDAPRLPLARCPLGDRCRCAYKHHDDRRMRMRRVSDRRTADPTRPALWSGPERRRSGGRRRTDGFVLR